MSRPQFTVAVTFYDVERYLRATLRSLERQTYGVDRLEIVLVDDGSTDGSAAIAERWARGRRNVRLVRQENAGPGAARNRVLEIATGEWYTSVDADDLLDRDYFAAIARVLRRDAEGRADLVAPRIYLLDDRTGRYRDRHPLGHKYRFGDRLARLADEPEAFVLGTAFALRTDVLRRHGLAYDPRIVPTFEDAHLIGRYLARLDDPVVAVAASARYLYRKRTAGDSLVQSAWERPERFTVVPELGYLDLLREATRGRDRTPVWAQCMVLYDVLWYLKEEQSMSSRVGWVDGDLAARFLATLEQVMAHVDAATIEGFCANPHPWTTRQALLTRYADDGVVPRAFRWGDDALGRVQVSVLHRGPGPALRAFRDGVEVEPVVVGTRRHSAFGHELMIETAVRWPSGGEVSLWVDGVPARLQRISQPRAGRPPTAAHRLTAAGPAPGALARRAAGVRRVTEIAGLAGDRSRPVALAGLAAGALRSRVARAERARRRRRTEALRERAAATEVRERYRDAWLVMDRVQAADDNGEHLYRYLMRSRPDIDAYFVLDRASAHWDRLAAEGFRLLAHGSDDARLLAVHAAARLSSDAVEACMYPAPRRDFGDPAGIFVFLQHGVTKDDISRWLNSKRIDLLITATEAEHASFVGPGSPYALTSEQVVRTGFARYDRLLALRRTTERDGGILVMPTWRRPLREALASCRSEAERSRVLESSRFGSAWLELLRHPGLAALAGGSGGHPVRVLLHPLLADAADAVRLPPHVELLDGAAVSIQQELVRSRLLLTDYTSVAFDAAFAGVPVVYYQFDRDAMFDGTHPLRAGYFDYRADGFGPVVEDADAAVRAIGRAVAAGPVVPEPYRSRAARTFPAADGRCCERIVAAVERRIAETRGP